MARRAIYSMLDRYTLNVILSSVNFDRKRSDLKKTWVRITKFSPELT